MSIVLPGWLGAAALEWSLERATVRNTSQINKSVQVVDLLGWAWRVVLTLPPTTKRERMAEMETLCNRLAGGVLELELHHMARPVPLGTMRGTPVLANDVPQFGDGVVLSGAWAAGGVVPGTLRAGDMIKVGGDLLQVAEACAADGAGEIVVPTVNRLRSSLGAGTAVVWSRPTSRFICVSGNLPSVYMPGRGGAQSIELIEVPEVGAYIEPT